MTIKETLAAIKAAGMAGTFDRETREYRVTYPKGEGLSAKRLEAVASYSDDAADAIATAKRMRAYHVVIWKSGKVAATSRNMRGVMRYAAKCGVSVWSMSMSDSYGAAISIVFGDGASASFDFRSWDVAQRWIRARRSWNLEGASIRPTFEGWRAT